jgi:hypothetical protein
VQFVALSPCGFISVLPDKNDSGDICRAPVGIFPFFLPTSDAAAKITPGMKGH